MTGAALPLEEPTADLSGEIPSVIEAPKSRVSKPAVTFVLLTAAIVLGLVVFGAFRFFKSRMPEARASEQAKPTAAAANAPGSSRLFGDTPPAPPKAAPTTAAPPLEKFPAVDMAEVKPIPLKGEGTTATRATSNGKPALTDADGPMLVTQPGRGGLSRDMSRDGGGPTVLAQNDAGASATDASPLDATQRALANYQQQLAQTMENLNKRVAGATGPGILPAVAPDANVNAAAAQQAGARNLFGGALQGSRADKVSASFLGNRSLTLAKGTSFTCALKTKVISATSGMVACQVLRNVYSDDGRTVLIERGSQLDGEYRVQSVRPGITRIPTIWTRARTPNGVVIDLESPATGALGEGGIGGYVDNRWGERIGAALLVGFLDDALRFAVATADNNSGNGNNTVVLGSTGEQAQRLPEKILDSTINLPPLIYQNQGALVGVYLARDIDFSSVYELKSTSR